MKLTFQEKSLWASLVSTLVIFSYYFYRAFPALRDPLQTDNSPVGVLIGVVILIIIIQIAMQVTLAIRSRKEAERQPDERENLISLKASRSAHFILVVGVWITIMSIYFEPTGLALINTLLFFFILSEIAGYALQLIYYRRGY